MAIPRVPRPDGALGQTGRSLSARILTPNNRKATEHQIRRRYHPEDARRREKQKASQGDWSEATPALPY